MADKATQEPDDMLVHKRISTASTNAAVVKASPGKLHGWYLFNIGNSLTYLKIYNKASAPTVGTDIPVLTLPLNATSGANLRFEDGIDFSAGIAIAITGGIADADTTAIASSEYVANIFYR